MAALAEIPNHTTHEVGEQVHAFAAGEGDLGQLRGDGGAQARTHLPAVADLWLANDVLRAHSLEIQVLVICRWIGEGGPCLAEDEAEVLSVGVPQAEGAVVTGEVAFQKSPHF